MVGLEVVSAPRLRPELAQLPIEFINLFEAVVRLVDENPADEGGHPEHGTRIFLPTPTEDRTTSAFIGWEDEPKPFSTVDNSGNILELNNIAHVNIESAWEKSDTGRTVWSSAQYSHILTSEGVVVRQINRAGTQSVEALSPEAVIVLTKRLIGFEDSEALARDRTRRAARWQIEFALSDGPRSPLETAKSSMF